MKFEKIRRDSLFRYPEFKEAVKEQREFEKAIRLSREEVKELDNALRLIRKIT